LVAKGEVVAKRSDGGEVCDDEFHHQLSRCAAIIDRTQRFKIHDLSVMLERKEVGMARGGSDEVIKHV
jgi:hypothetical protein